MSRPTGHRSIRGLRRCTDVGHLFCWLGCEWALLQCKSKPLQVSSSGGGSGSACRVRCRWLAHSAWHAYTELTTVAAAWLL